MAYIRPQPKQRISKEERKQLLQEYYLHYKGLIHDQGIEALNLKIPREVFSSVLDEVGVLLREPLSSYLKMKRFANFWRKHLFLRRWPHSFLKISECLPCS